MLLEQQYRELCSGAYGLVERDVPLSKYTTFQIGGPVDVFIEPTSEKELVRSIRYLRAEQIPFYLMGNGSNLLVRDGGLRGAVIHLGKHYSDVVINGNSIRAQAGASLASIAKMSFRASLTGMEALSGIPGSVGGAAAMNAGAYNAEMKDVVSAVRVINREGEITTLRREEMDFSYRHSRVQSEDLIVSEVYFELMPGEAQEIEAAYRDYTARRTSKQPLEKASAGSTFKRPAGGYASALIDNAGLRGYSVGAAQVSEKHCGFLVNNGGASASQILELIDYVSKEVERRFGIRLEPEVRIIGEDRRNEP
ncbi:MAG: UDP-N-acetylmuramate dehydrogenase [Ndongobacter sp.]|nr:UDP-N-acetylmuramate dehydrogenase [Ndongobacter sp.]